MDVDEPFRYRLPQHTHHHPEEAATSTSSRSVRLRPTSSRRSSHSGQSRSDGRAKMSIVARRPAPALRQPISLHDEMPVPPREYHQPPPLAPYVPADKRVHPPRITNWGVGPDPGIERHMQSNPHPSLPTPIHQPPRKERWRRLVESGAEHPYARPVEPLQTTQRSHPPSPTDPRHRHVVHPPPSARVTLPSIHDAISSSSMRRTWSHASEPAISTSRTYSRSQAGSSGSRPSSHGSSGHQSGLADGHLGSPPDKTQSSGQRRRRTRALMTDMQQQKLKQLWKETKFPGNADRERLGAMIGLTPRQVQVWFQNQRQKARKEINAVGIPADADPRDWNDLDKSPRTRRLSLEAADAAAKVRQWNAAQTSVEARSTTSPDEPVRDSAQLRSPATEPTHRELKHLIKNRDVRPAHPGTRIHPYEDHNHHNHHHQPSNMVPPGQWATGYRSPIPKSPVSHTAISPLLSNASSPTQPSFDHRGRPRPRLTASSGLPPTLIGSTRSPVEVSFGAGSVPVRQVHTFDGEYPNDSPRRRSTSLEGMKPGRTPSPHDQPSKRSRTHTVTSELPPSLAALALSAPITESHAMASRQLPRVGLDLGMPPRETYMGPPPTLPPSRGRAHERMDGHYRSHTDSTQILHLQRQAQAHEQARLPGPGSLFRPTSDYR